MKKIGTTLFNKRKYGATKTATAVRKKERGLPGLPRGLLGCDDVPVKQGNNRSRFVALLGLTVQNVL
jgi:hypothetical protein